ncbi:MAG: hypothetical protein JJW01_03040 [Alphaproteobacteria bacterium]|nr:hypothetical protein [Rickettsiales bacterium]
MPRKRFRLKFTLIAIVWCVTFLVSVKIAIIFFRIAAISNRLNKSGIVERYNIVGFKNCLIGNECGFYLKNIRIRFNQDSNLFIPFARLSANYNEQNNLSISIPAETRIVTSLSEQNHVVVLLELVDELIVDFWQNDEMITFKTINPLTANILLDNKMLGFVKNTKIITSLTRNPQTPKKISKNDKVNENRFVSSVNINSQIELKTIDYFSIGQKLASELGDKKKDVIPINVVFNMERCLKESENNFSITANNFDIKGSIALKNNTIDGSIVVNSWQNTLDDIANMAAYLMLGYKNELSADDILVHYQFFYNKIVPKLFNNKNNIDKHNETKDITIDIKTENNKVTLNGIKFDYLFKM